MANVDDVGGNLPAVNLGPVSKESLLAEAAAMGDRFSEVATHPADLVADAEEMLEGRADAADLIERGYPVTPALFDRIRLLTEFLAPLAADQAVDAAASASLAAEAELARVRLLEIRGTFARLGKAAGLPATLFSLQSERTTRLNVVLMRMEEVLENVQRFRSRMPDLARLDALAIEARRLIDGHKEARRRARFSRVERSIDARTQERVERLLLDAMQYLSAQGLAAYGDDSTRELRYRLDHVYGRRPSRVGDPGAGGPSATT